jgi:hypothetical protein
VGKEVSESKSFSELVSSFKEKSPKEMRTLRNALNNRIKSFEDESTYGKALPNLSLSHKLYGFTLGQCRDLLVQSKKVLKDQKEK